MMKNSLFVVLVVVMAACAPAPEPTATPLPPTPTEVPDLEVSLQEPTPPPSATPVEAAVTTPEVEAVVEDPTPEVEVVEETAPESALPTFASLPLTNVNTGETFTLADLATDKPVYVHMMATWCTNCRASQSRLSSDVIPQVGDAAEFVSIDVQTQLDAPRLADYTQSNGFGWTFAVANTDLMNALAEEFGRTVSNPPSTPHFVVYPNGTVSALQTGSQSSEQVIALINGA